MKNSLQSIFKNNFARYREKHGLSIEQYQAAQAIMRCQSDELGHEEWVCHHDGHIEIEHHSCRHRSCPRCNHGMSRDWLEKIQHRLLNCDHYHVVFTLPHELNAVWQHNRAWCSDHLFRAAVETLKQLLADERFLGAEVGIVAALHTWGRTLSFHPHVHLLVTGGGLTPQGQWRECQRDFLLPVGVIKAKFRGKWLDWLNTAYRNGELRLPEGWRDAEFKKVLCRIAKKEWNVRIQGAYRHGNGVTTYLSRYVRGGPIKESRLVAVSDDAIRFRYLDHRDGKSKVMSLKPDDFIGRVLFHVPVKGRHLVRYYGLYVPGARQAREMSRRVLGIEKESPATVTRKEHRCPECGAALFHYLSRRCKISYIWSAPVQQDVQADHENALPGKMCYERIPPGIFLGHSWPLNS